MHYFELIKKYFSSKLTIIHKNTWSHKYKLKYYCLYEKEKLRNKECQNLYQEIKQHY